MDRTKKLQISADAECCHCFKTGVFARFYEQSLYWFSHAVKPLKPMPERVKGGEPVIYGGLPISSLELLIEQGALQQAESTEYGWKWPYAGQQAAVAENTPEFAAWREDTARKMPRYPSVPAIRLGRSAVHVRRTGAAHRQSAGHGRPAPGLP